MIEIVTNDGTLADFKELLRISSTYAALQLELKDGKLAVADGSEPGQSPPSGTLQARMLQMINDKLASARLEIVTSLTFGSFGQSQRFNAAFALDVTDKVPQAGIAIMIHEMWENYTAQGLPGLWKKRFGPAHQAAVVTESAVMSELTGLTLDRVASVQDRSAGQAVFVLDYHLQYVVISPTGGGSGATRHSYSAVRRDRKPVCSLTLANTAMTDPANQTAITEAVAILKKNPQATAAITGGLASQIRNEIAVRLKEDFYLDSDHPEQGLEKEDEKGKGADIGDLRSFVDSAAVTDDAPHGKIIITTPA